MGNLRFHVKQICWSPYEQKLPILLQEKNGPCPLIALVNTLILTDDVEARTVGLLGAKGAMNDPGFAEIDGSESNKEPNPETGARKLDVSSLRSMLQRNVGGSIEISLVLSCLGDILLEIPTLGSEVVNGLLESLPLLHTGLDVNPNLTDGGFKESDLASQIFNAFGLHFVHGWCREDDDNSELNALFGKYPTFEDIQEYILTLPEETVEKMQMEAWIHENATQLTEAGLKSIDTRMAPDSLAIFFRNNHFLTVYKAQNHDLYLLITDSAFLKRPHYVWQLINSVSGNDDLYFAGDFTPLLDDAGLDESHVTDDSLAFARKLQEKEDSDYAKLLQRNYEKSVRQLGQQSSGGIASGPQNTDINSRGRKSGQASSQVNPSKGKKKEACRVM